MVQSVTGKNLFSFEEFSVDFTTGVTLIEGYNHDDGTEEGCGKSALLNTISWILYGEIPKDSKIDDVVRSGTKSATATVILSNGFEVTRSRKPNDLFMYDNRLEHELRGKDAKETQEMIISMLGMSFKTFCQSVYFAQNYPNKFVTATEEDKAKILSEIEDLSQFDRARKEVMAQIKVLEPELSLLERDHQHLQSTRDSLLAHHNGLLQMKAIHQIDKDRDLEIIGKELDETQAEFQAKEAFIEQVSSEKQRMEQELSDTNQTISNIQAELATIEVGYKNLDKIKRMLSTNGNSLMSIMREIAAFNKDVQNLSNPKQGEVCPTCGSDLSKADEETIKNHIAALNSKIFAKTNEYEVVNAQVADLDKEAAGIQVPTEKIKELKDAIKILDGNRRNLESGLVDIKRANQDMELIRKQLLSLTQRYKHVEDRNSNELDQQMKAASDKLDDTNYKMSAKILDKEKTFALIAKLSTLKDAFKEVKSFAFRNTLLELNDKVNGYLSQLFNQGVQARFYNEGEGGEVSKILCEVTIDGEARPLGLYSGGQFRRIQLSVDLALSDLISSRNKNSINFRIFDEYFKDLSETSMENCLKLFQSLKGTTILVEHNSLFKSIVNQTIQVELTEGVSRVVESEYGSETLEVQNM